MGPSIRSEVDIDVTFLNFMVIRYVGLHVTFVLVITIPVEKQLVP